MRDLISAWISGIVIVFIVPHQWTNMFKVFTIFQNIFYLIRFKTLIPDSD